MTELVKIQAANTAELLGHFDISDDAESCVQPDASPEHNLNTLMEAGLYHDAVTLLAHGLPKREAVWWACLAARAAITPETDEANMAALVAAESWVKKPTEEKRLKCRELGKKSKYNTATSWAATAACWSTGNMVEDGDVEVSTPEYLYAHAVAGSVSLAATSLEPEKLEETYKYFLSQGIDLAKGGNGRIEQ